MAKKVEEFVKPIEQPVEVPEAPKEEPKIETPQVPQSNIIVDEIKQD